MSEKVERIRNIALIGHGGAGKTSLAEALLYKSGTIKRLGKVEEGNTVMDFEPEELKRRSSISSGFHQFSWKNHTVNLIDTPGDQNFFSDTKSSMQAADGVVVVIDAVDGVKVQTELAWEFAKAFKQPCVIFINKLDRERADFNRTFEDAKVSFEPKPIILQLPIGAEAEFKGVVDLIRNQAYVYDADGKPKKEDIPAEMQDLVESERETLIENIAEADDALIERYLEGEALSDEEYSYLRGIWQNNVNDSGDEAFLPGPLVGIGSNGDTKINTKIRQRLQSIERPIMPVDDKRLASWNALMLQALVAGASFDQKYREAAQAQFEFMRKSFIENGEVVRFAGNGELAETTFEDYAHVSLAFLEYGRALQDPEAIRWAQKLALSAYARSFENDRWHANSGSLIPTDPGQWVIQDAVSPSAQTAWFKVIISSPDTEKIIGAKAGKILHRVTREMLNTPYYYGSLIALRQQLSESAESKTALQ
jgi:small GTP-binding protein